MILILWLLVGLVGGVAIERLILAPKAPASTVDDAATGRAPGRRQRRSRPRRILGWSALVVVLFLVAGVVGGYLWANSIFNRIEKVDVSAQLSHGSGDTNYLLVGSDNGRTPDDERQGVQGSRSDTILVLHIQGNSAKMLSLNRDLFVTNPATGRKGRLNSTYNTSSANLVQAVTADFAIPIDRYIEIDFASFAGLVDSFGGIDIDFANPAFDLASGLDVKQAGRVHLDGTQALAYVRSRHYYEMIDGKPRAEGGLPDVNRTQRQQTFLRAIMAKLGDKRNPTTLLSAASKMAKGLRIDNDMTLFDAGRFAWRMGRLQPQSVPLPVLPRTTSGGADVLYLGPGADEVLAQFR